MKRFLFHAAQTVVGLAGLELRRKSERDSEERKALEGALTQATRAGLAPNTILDVGAAYGATAYLLSTRFPNARLIAIEALRAYAPSLEKIVTGRGQIVWAAAGAQDGTATFNVHRDLVGSSLYKEAEGDIVNGEEQTVPMIALDPYAARERLTGPYLVKIDVQGAELDVLRGAETVLAHTEYLILEVSLFQTFVGGTQLADVVRYLAERGFSCYDILDGLYRPIDGALCQVDMCFVKTDGFLRTDHRYATPDQRRAQDEAMRRTVEALKK